MTRVALVGSFTCIALLLGPAVARADAISPPPSTCPAWSEPVECHGAPTCRLSECTSDAGCGPGERCRMLEVCNVLNNCGGMAGMPLIRHAGALCSDGCEGLENCNARM